MNKALLIGSFLIGIIGGVIYNVETWWIHFMGIVVISFIGMWIGENEKLHEVGENEKPHEE
jgi:hypothetical protein